MSGLFDLPFEEPEPEPAPEPRPAPAAPAPPPARPARRVLTVSELTGSIREILETTFPEIWVEGELSNARVWTTGHLYFTLKDGGAQIKGVMFRSALRYLKFKPEDGLHVVVRGRLSVYDPKGEYQLVGEQIEPHGFGALQLAFEQLKKKLAGEGLFEAARKRPLPALPRRIGIVTSIDGAALRDIVRVLHRRYPNAHLVIAPSRVQGEDAAGELVRAIRQIGRIEGVDVVIVGRGGGSLEDLWAFNEEKVARAIAACPVPVISAVGHETDVTIADFVADLRRRDALGGGGAGGAAQGRVLRAHRPPWRPAGGRGPRAGAPARVAAARAARPPRHVRTPRPGRDARPAHRRAACGASAGAGRIDGAAEPPARNAAPRPRDVRPAAPARRRARPARGSRRRSWAPRGRGGCIAPIRDSRRSPPASTG